MDEYKMAYSKFSNEESLVMGREKVYKKLMNLEIDGLKDTEEYTKQLNVLDFINETFKNKIDKTRYQLIDLIYACAYIKNELIIMNVNDEESIMYKHDDLSYRYLFNLFFNKTIEKIERVGSVNSKESIKSFSTIKYNKRMSSTQIDFDRYISEDINRVYLSMIQDKIDNTKDKKLKEELIEAKYKLIYMNYSLESEMLQSNYKVDEIIPLKANFFIDYLGISEERAYNLFNRIIFNNLVKNKREILEYSDREIKANELELTLRSCYIRANLFLVNEDSIIRDNIEYYDEVSKRDYFDGYSKGDIIITDSYSSAMKDKVKYKALIIK